MTSRPICAICWEGQHPGRKAPKKYWGKGKDSQICGRCGRHTIAGLTEPDGHGKVTPMP